MTRCLPAVLLVLAHCATATPSWRALQQQRVEPAPQPPERVLSPVHVDQDLDLARRALDRGYGGKAFVPRDAWTTMRTHLDALGGSAQTVQALCDGLAAAFWLLPDAHLSAKRQAPDGANVRCGNVVRRKPAVGANRHNAAQGVPWSVERVEEGTFPLLRISIVTFPPGKSPPWEGFTAALEARRDVRGIVVDLRGNDGGDDSRGYELAQVLLDGPVEGNVVRTHYRQTPETLTLLLNTLDRVARQKDGTLPDWMAPMYLRVERWRDDVTKTPSPEYKVVDEPPYTPVPGPEVFPGKVAVLVDAGCASSCESTLEVLRRHPRARVFGERTAGFIHFGDVGSLTLPHSGIRLGIPTKYQEYPGNIIYDKTGFEPDEAVTTGTDAWNPAVAWLQAP